MKVNEKEIWLIHLYGPNQDDPYFFENIYTNLLNLQATNNSLEGVPTYAEHLLAAFPSFCGPTHPNPSQSGDCGGQVI